jgi:hypothetical protein
MLSPDYLLHISEGSEQIAEELHVDIINRIVDRVVARLDRGEEFMLTSYDKWQIETLQESGYLLEDIQEEIARKTKQQTEEVKEAMEEAGVTALEYDDKIYQDAGLSPVALEQSPYMVRLMQDDYKKTMGEWKNFTRTMATSVQSDYIRLMDTAYNLVSSGAVSYTQAFKEVLDKIINDGIEVKYPSGRKDTVETATLRAVRTGISQMSAHIQIARMNEMEVDLVIVSSHLGARPDHQKWQGKVYSRTGTNYPDFVENTRYGHVDGLCGANCRHNFSPYFEGMSNPFEHYDSEENRKRYELEQRQRALERRIRDTKRKCINQKEVIDNCKNEKLKYEYDLEYQKKSALLQKQNKAYKDFCAENDLRPLNERIQIAKWNRQQAAAARGAAKRHENAKGD